MIKKAMISISSMQMNDEDQIVEVITPGTFEILEDCFKIEYEESEISGMEGTTTYIKIEKNKLTLERKGTTETVMVFENSGSNVCLYNTPFGVIEMTTNTKVLDININKNGGAVKIEYNLLVLNQAPIDTSLSLEVKVI